MVEVVCPPGDHRKVPPPGTGVAVNEVLLPLQIVAFVTDRVGGTSTFTVPDPLTAAHPARRYETLYVVVVLGATVMLGVLAPPGVQVYAPPGLVDVTEIVALLPRHTVSLVTVSTGRGCTVTAPVSVAVPHPAMV